MAIYLAPTIEAGNQKQFIAGPFETSVDAAQSGSFGYLFEVIGDGTPVLLPVYLRNPDGDTFGTFTAGVSLAPGPE